MDKLTKGEDALEEHLIRTNHEIYSKKAVLMVRCMSNYESKSFKSDLYNFLSHLYMLVLFSFCFCNSFVAF